jgi:hypothetical protein
MMDLVISDVDMLGLAVVGGSAVSKIQCRFIVGEN